MSIFDYIDLYGKYSFDEREFNEVDNVIFSSFVYLDLSDIVPYSKKNKKTIGIVASEYFLNYSSHEKRIMALRNAIDILRAIQNQRRYRDVFVYGYSYIGDEHQQFSAVCLEFMKDVVYVAFEGTDQLISGWEEDFKMAYEFPVLSQKRAISYVDRLFTFSFKKLIFGGHSKGGNLALVASMYCNFLVRNKIVRVYNNDGPGLKKKQLESKAYHRIENRFIHIVVNYSFFGLLFGHTDRYIVIKSSKHSIVAHAVVTWEVEMDHFVRTQLSAFSKILEEGMRSWLEKYNDQEREKFVEALFDIFRNANVHNLVEIMENKKLILSLIRESNEMDSTCKKMIWDFVSILFRYFKDYSLLKLKDLF